MRYIIGADEVGLGSLAGPLLVCAVAVPQAWAPPEGLDDSKKLSPKERSRLNNILLALPAVAVFAADSCYIDNVGVKEALMAAHEGAIKELLGRYPGVETDGVDVVIDGVLRPPGLPQAYCVPKADSLYPAVSAASVIAKVQRDLLMVAYHQQYPYYAWDKNMGYPTKAHFEGLKKHGVTPLHRRSYTPIKKLLETPCTSTPT